MARRTAPTGHATRGTTGTNRLRRVDRWIAARREFTTATAPLVVDLGFGASGVTAFELYARLVKTNPTVEVLGIEIDAERVARATEQLAQVRTGTTAFPANARVSFVKGGFETPTARAPQIIRAFNVLRQYDEADVPAAWKLMASRLNPGGLLIEGTCDEIGRVSSWIDIDHTTTPLRFTVSLRLAELDAPSIVAERLPKALIHHNVPGERIHAYLAALDDAWERNAPLGTFGTVQRWLATVRAVKEAGWPVQGTSTRWRLGEVTVDWESVAP